MPALQASLPYRESGFDVYCLYGSIAKMVPL